MTSEGERVFKQASALREQGINSGTVAVDPAESTVLGTISVYPLYGKLNLFNRSIAQFDVYMIGGAGTTKLSSGSSPTFTAGGGLGLWMTQHIAGRLEARWQGHQDQVGGESRDVNQTILSASFGFLL
jgi:outer membrane beta-barrel protein